MKSINTKLELNRGACKDFLKEVGPHRLSHTIPLRDFARIVKLKQVKNFIKGKAFSCNGLGLIDFDSYSLRLSRTLCVGPIHLDPGRQCRKGDILFGVVIKTHHHKRDWKRFDSCVVANDLFNLTKHIKQQASPRFYTIRQASTLSPADKLNILHSLLTRDYSQLSEYIRHRKLQMLGQLVFHISIFCNSANMFIHFSRIASYVLTIPKEEVFKQIFGASIALSAASLNAFIKKKNTHAKALNGYVFQYTAKEKRNQ